MVDYKVFYLLWASCVVFQCCSCGDSQCSYLNVSSSLEVLAENADKIVVPVAVISFVASIFSNWLWRFLVFALVWGLKVNSTLLPFLPFTYLGAFTLWAMIHTSPILGGFCGIREPMKLEKDVHAVFVTGCDSGMGYWTAVYLAQLGCHVYAGCFNVKESEKKLFEQCKLPVAPPGEKGPIDHIDADVTGRITCIDLDVTDEKKVQSAAAAVEKAMASKPNKQSLIGIINCAGLGYNGPAEYFPMHMYEKQMQVNCFGYIRVIQTFMPLLKAGSSKNRRGRIISVGTGGGVLSPTPPLLAAYMASKWAVEGFMGSLRLDLQLTNQPIDAVMLNPGFVKPTMLQSIGLSLTESMWKACYDRFGDNRAKDEYGPLLNTFIDFSSKEKGTHVSKVAHVMAQIMTEFRPNACYKVGDDSKAAPVVGLLPTYIREFIVKYSMYKTVGST